MEGTSYSNIKGLWSFIKIIYNVLRLGGRFNAAKPLLYAVADLETKI